jgi:hypothetical protein
LIMLYNISRQVAEAVGVVKRKEEELRSVDV